MRAAAIRVGDFFFRHRNWAFPLALTILFVLAPPTTEAVGSRRLDLIKDAIAVLIALAGLALRAAVIGFAYIKRGGLNKEVYAKTLVTGGLFGVCRNPLYAGNLLICLGLLLLHGDPVVFTLGLTFFVLAYSCIVLAEERYLAATFGDDYRRYCAETPRWLPRFSRFRTATEGMAFKARRVIRKDYATIALTLALLAATEAYEQLSRPDPSARLVYLMFLAAVMILCGLWALLFRTSKRRVPPKPKAA